MKRYLFIIGAQRSGTTMLARILDEHPDISFAKPIRPEPKYLLGAAGKISPDEYEARYFRDVPERVVRAEKSTSYIEYPDVAQRIVEYFPGARCIALLRNPVERAISNYWFSVEHGFEHRPPEEALRPDAESTELVPGVSASPFAYIRRGRYLDYLDAYSRIVGAGNMLVLQTEQIISGQADWPAIYGSLGVSAQSPAPPSERANSVKRERPVHGSTIQQLTAYYAPHNEALAMRYPLDLDLWRATP